MSAGPQTTLNCWLEKFHAIKNILNEPAEIDETILQAKNSKWLEQLNTQFNQDSDIKTYIENLKDLDRLIAENQLFQSKVEENLKDIVVEIEAYKQLTERSFNALFEMSQANQDCKNLADCAKKAREDLFEICDEVKQLYRWEETEPVTTSSELDVCQQGFLEVLKNLSVSQELHDDTANLFRNLPLDDLTESDLNELIKAWERAVSWLVNQAKSSEPGDAMTIGRFLCFGNSLETLYSRLATNVSLKSNL